MELMRAKIPQDVLMRKMEVPAPAAGRLGDAASLAKVKALMANAGEREAVTRVISEGWTGISKTVSSSVPTIAANRSYCDAMDLARNLLSTCQDPEVLSDLRSILMTNPMLETFNKDPRYVCSSPPLVDEVNAKLASLATMRQG